MKRTIYALEDDPALRELYLYTLEREFNCRCFGESGELFAAMGEGAPDLILLDIMLPGEDGFAVLSRLKSSAFAAVPVIMVSAKGEEISKVKGLDMGACDYIAKPFGVLELVARVNAHLRDAPSALQTLTHKDITVDDTRHAVLVRGAAVRATLKEYNLLRYLCERPGAVRRREDIFRAVWGEGYMGETRTLDIHIRQLREKLAVAGSEASIRTVRGVGYTLV
ncbi:MAG: response regulator transcription factor [Oscillospiraceae bacterium]|jgi:two-component system alkaline phosphatase synthesis response regulator PhoP|nr:response regulator transcription factor [Oscillospiraceae bacterium]